MSHEIFGYTFMEVEMTALFAELETQLKLMSS
jgi:hypothetical protein